MTKTLIRGARIWDGSGAEPTNGDLLINGDRIEAVGSGLSAIGVLRCVAWDPAVLRY